MDPTVPRNVAATMVVSVTGLLGSATALLAISGIGECEALGSWSGAGRRWWSSVYTAVHNLGPRCQEQCPMGRFGQDCAETCDCAPGARCFPANGACLCEHGFTGHRCTERLCPDGLYGLSCQEPCTCDPEHSLRWAVGNTVTGDRFLVWSPEKNIRV